MSWFQPNPLLWKGLFQSRKKRFKIAAYVLGGLFLLLVFLVWIDIPPMTEIENPRLDRSTQIYSADAKLIGTFYEDQNRIYIPYHKIAHTVTDALIATEDIRFFSHSGIDPVAIPAIAKDLFIHFRIRGASTITMQLARNLYNSVGKKKSLFRKLKEAVVSILLERKFTKEEILEAYLNTTSFYGDTYGIENASQTLFGKPAENLNIEESATLVGMLKGPSLYNPVRRPDTTRARRNVVLNQMVKYRYLTERKADSLKALPLKLKFSSMGNPTTSLAPYFKDFVKQWIKDWMKREGKDYNLYTDGLKVYTTIDSKMQAHAEKAMVEHMSAQQKTFDTELSKRKKAPWDVDASILKRALENSERFQVSVEAGMSKAEILRAFSEPQKMKIWTWDGWTDTTMTPKDSLIHYIKFLQTGFVSMDPRSGAIKAWVGGVNYRLFQYDHVSQSKRQVGSTFKPFVYGQAIDEGLIKPCDFVMDMPVTLELGGGRTWTPSNSDGKSEGMMSFMKALAKSKNQVTAWVMKNLGPDGPAKVCRFARAAGILSPMDCVPSLCLGTSDLSVIEITNAYCAFAANGMHYKPMFITRIEDRFGNVLVEFKPEGSQVMDARTAYTIAMMLVNNVNDLEGTGHSVLSYGIRAQVGGKTGTTSENADGWFVGITPDLVSGVWVGCEDRNIRFLQTAYGQGARAALPIWGKYMSKVYSDKDIRFPRGIFYPPENYDLSLECPLPPENDTMKVDSEDAPWIR